MKHFGKGFVISVACTLLAAATAAFGYYEIAAFLCWPGFFFNAGEVKSYGTYYQFVNFRVNGLVHGYIIDLALGEPYYLFTIALFLLSFAGVMRLEFFKSWGFTHFHWSEITSLVLVYAIYFYANVQHAGDWRGWVLPVFPILFMTYIGTNLFRDASRLRANPTTLSSKPGDPAIDFSLPAANGGTINLSDFKGKNHVLLLFVRGDWCPTCHIMMRIYEKNREKFSEKQVVAIGISPDDNEVNQQMISRLGWQNFLLTDSTQEVTRKYGGSFFANNRETKYPEGIPLPASVLVDKSGIIRYVSTPGKANEFLDPSHIFPVVAQLN
jgi:peroxiredoxin